VIVLCTVKFVLPQFAIVIAWPWFALDRLRGDVYRGSRVEFMHGSFPKKL